MVTPFITIKIDASKARSKLQRVKDKVAKLAGETTKELAEYGKQTARNLAPYDTGRVRRFIIKKQNVPTPFGMVSRVVAQNPTRNPPKGYRGTSTRWPNGKFNLTRWMHESPRAAGHIKTGDPKFMITTSRILNKQKGRVARSKFGQLNIR